MTYHIDDKRLLLSALKQRIESTDLVPSRDCLKKSLDTMFQALGEYGIKTTAELRQIYRNKKKMDELCQSTGIPSELLILLRREVEGYFPHPFPITQFNWLPGEDIQYFIAMGINNTADLYHAVENGSFEGIKPENGEATNEGVIALANMSNLTRVQWVNPTTARMLMDAGYDSVKKLAEADPEVLCNRLAAVNHDGRYFNGKIGLRDVKRLVAAASYLQE